MSKKWQELEFHDYKERQVRRRAQKKRRLLEQSGLGDDIMASAADPEAEKSLQKKIVAGGLCLVVLLLLYIFFLRAGETGPGKEGVRLVRMRGEVMYSSAFKEWAPARGEIVPRMVHVVTGKDGRATLSLHVPDTRIVLFENTDVLFSELKVGRSSGDFQLKVDIVKGEAVFEFTNEKGIGIISAHIPQDVDLMGKLVYFKVRAGEQESRVIVADGYLKAESKGDIRIIPGDQQMISTYMDPIRKPQSVSVLRERWTW